MCNIEASVTLTECRFTLNTASGSGGGLYNQNSGPIIATCTFKANDAVIDGGGVHNLESSPFLSDCTVASNTAGGDGGGVCNRNASPSLARCTVYENMADGAGGGVFSSEDSAPNIEDSTFCGNMPGGPGTYENQVEGPFNDGGGNCFTAVCGYGDGDELPECGSACPADIDGNGEVNGADLSLVLGAWGTSDAAADFDGSGTVDGADLALVLGAWGACPE